MPDEGRRPASACEPGAWAFSRAEEVWAGLEPLTPLGRDAKEERLALGDAAAIEELYDETEAAAEALARLDGPGRDRLSHYLGRVPRLPEALAGGDGPDAPPGAGLEEIDVFLAKRFLASYRAILGLLGPGDRERFGLGFESEALLALLAKGGSDEESFYVSDAYDPALAPLRERIRAVDEELARFRAAAEEAAERELGLAFRGRAFLVLPSGSSRPLAARGGAGDGAPRFSVEPYDSSSCVVRILPGEGELRAESERERLLAEELELESAALAGLSEAILAEAPRLARYQRALLRFDLARARAVIAHELGLSRPILRPGRLAISGGRLLPLEADCARRAQAYRPLDLELEERSALLFGSNMGGKSVALQTALCLQVLAQAGLFVPAERFETEAYAHIVYAGAPRPGMAEPGREDDGLSGFGREVDSLEGARRAARDGGAFVVLDELGRTTSSPEAEAIVAAAAEAFAALPGTRCLLATHFRGASPGPQVARLRMAGLDREAARAAAGDPAAPPAERARRIGALMRYEILREGGPGGAAGGGPGSDALEVAALLGLDGDMLARARAHYAAGLGREGGDRG